MNEAERIKAQLKRSRNKELFFYIAIIIFCTVIFCVAIFNFSGSYKPDPSLYKSYDLSKDIIPEPIQKKVEEDKITLRKHGVDIEIKKLASYDITGKVEALKDFSGNFWSNFFSFKAREMTNYISPRDLTLTWGKLALDENSNSISANQSLMNGQRVVMFSYTHALKEKYGEEYIKSHLSNNHIITLDDNLKKQLMKIKVTDIVRIKGYLVDVKFSNGGSWGPSSLVRNDTGNHSCEILYAEDIVIMKK